MKHIRVAAAVAGLLVGLALNAEAGEDDRWRWCSETSGQGKCVTCVVAQACTPQMEACCNRDAME